MSSTLLAGEIRRTTIGGIDDPRIVEATSTRSRQSPLAATELRGTEAISLLPSVRRRLLIEDEEAFVSQIWEKRPAVFRGRKGSFADLCSVEQVDRLIASRQLGWNNVTVIDSRSTSKRDLASFAELPDLRDKSLYVHLAEQYCKPLFKLCRDAETSFARPGASFLFLTPPGTQTRELHWDLFDVFILQLSGRKRWRLCPSIVDLPIVGQEFTRYSFSDKGPSLLETELCEGDVLYIPRGVLHEAIAEQSHSLHWTLGLRSIPWHDVVAETWRRSLEPLRHDGSNGAWSPPTASRTLGDLFASFEAQDPRAVAEDVSFHPGRASARSVPPYQAGNVLAYRECSTTKPRAHRFLYSHTGARHVLRRGRAGTMLVLSGFKVWIPRALDRELRHVMANPTVRIERLPRDLDGARLLRLADTLCSVGLLERGTGESARAGGKRKRTAGRATGAART